MVLTGSGDRAELMAGMPRVLAGGGRLDSFIESVARGLKGR
jgi:hypothetical protein